VQKFIALLHFHLRYTEWITVTVLNLERRLTLSLFVVSFVY